MICKTRGIVFRFTRFGESSIIVSVFTEAFGLQSYIVNGVRSARASGNKMALFQPLTLLDLVVYHRENANINRIREVKCLYPSHSLSTDIKKAAISMFVCEILNKTVREEAQSQEVFDFILNSLLTLDHQEEGYENFHLLFLIRLSRYLGFGAHTASQISGTQIFDQTTVEALERLLTADYTSKVAGINAGRRREILEALLEFYAEHVESFGVVKSVHVLRDVLS